MFGCGIKADQAGAGGRRDLGWLGHSGSAASGRGRAERAEPPALVYCGPEPVSWRGRVEPPRRAKFFPGRAKYVSDGRVAEVEHVGQVTSDVHYREGVFAGRDPMAPSKDGTDLLAQGLEVRCQVEGVE